MESTDHCILATPAKSATMKRTLISVFNGEGIPAFESLVDVPVALLTPLREKSAISSANQIVISPLAPITPDKDKSVQYCNSHEGIHLVTEDLNNKGRSKEFDTLQTVAMGEGMDLFADNGFSNLVAPITPGQDKTTQNCQPHEITESVDEPDGNIQNFLNMKVLSKHANSSFGGVSPRCPEIETDEDGETYGIDLNKTSRKKAIIRKKHRPKVIQEGKPIKSPRPVTPKTAENKERLIPKRTYVRKKKALDYSGTSSGIYEENKEKPIPMKTYVRKRKALNSSGALSGKIRETTNPCSSTAVKTADQLPKNATRSVRRSLDFSPEGEATDGCHVSIVSDVKSAATWKTSNAITTVSSREFTVELTQGREVIVTKSPAGVAFDLNRSLNQVLDEYIRLPENPTPSGQSSGTEIVTEHLGGSGSTKDAETDLSMLSDQEQVDSGRHSGIITIDDDVEKTGTKRDHDHINVSQHCFAKESPRDICFMHCYNEIKQASLWQETSGLSPYLPVVYKKRRTQRGQTWGCNRALLPKISRCFTFADAQWSAAFDRFEQSELVLAFDPTQRVTRKRSKVPTRARKPTPIAGAEDCSHLLCSPKRTKGSHVKQENKNYGPQACMDALFADTRFKITTKKRRKKGHVRLVSSMLSGMKQEREVASSKFRFLGQPFVRQAVVPYVDPMEVILEKLKHMRISGGQIKDIGEAKNSLIPYVGVNMMIPYGYLFDTIKRQRPRAKVDLDPETNRVWNLLMGKKNDDEADGVDMDKEKWWEAERRVFRGRADAFIARMHLIQGDRRFSKWNGSVVDSVVGVFLTQNVSDHLSSSAFMSLASRFPLNKEANAEKIITSKEQGDGTVQKMITSKEQGDGNILAFGDTIKWQEKISTPEEIAPGFAGASKKEKEAADISISLESISHELSQVHDEQLVELHPEARDTDFPAENTHQEVEILTETHHCGEQTEYLSVCNDLEETLETVNAVEFNLKNEVCSSKKEQPGRKRSTSRAKKANAETKKEVFDWEALRKEAFANGAENERSSETMDSLDWEAVRNADVNEISKTIRERGMNNVLAQRIKDFLDRLVEDHGSIDLEWLRNVPPDKAKEYLLSIRGLGLKSVECVRLLTLHHLAFPVDTNVGRVCVRLGWVPLQPLPESLQLHLLELYPMIEHIQKYLWPRLCTLDQQTLYELHYQMITFGKVFCTKTKPNCNACPMRGECKHFTSAFASARLPLPGPQEKRLVTSRIPATFEKERSRVFVSVTPPQLEGIKPTKGSANNDIEPIIEEPAYNLIPLPQLEGIQPAKGSVNNDCEPIIEEPATPEHECTQTLVSDIEDAFFEDPEEIPTINLSSEEFKKSLKNYMQENKIEIQDGEMSKALVAITADAASIPMPKLKNVSRLRTEHQVYELPDSHCLLEGMDPRVPGDPSPYLLAIWTPGETSQSTEPPQSCCKSQDSAKLCDKKTCFACNSVREAQARTVRGTVLIPCRTAMKGSFPLNGTYFQVNEVFADHSSSRKPIDVPRNWIWNLPRRTVYFGTSVSTIFKGLTTEGIQQCFWRGFVCVRGFDRASRAPRPLYARLHFPPSKALQNKKTPAKEEGSTFSNI